MISTSIIRDPALNPGCYDSLLHFSRASSWSLEEIRKRWFSAVRLCAPFYREGNYHVLAGDGVKQSKPGRLGCFTPVRTNVPCFWQISQNTLEICAHWQQCCFHVTNALLPCYLYVTMQQIPKAMANKRN